MDHYKWINFPAVRQISRMFDPTWLGGRLDSWTSQTRTFILSPCTGTDFVGPKVHEMPRFSCYIEKIALGQRAQIRFGVSAAAPFLGAYLIQPPLLNRSLRLSLDLSTLVFLRKIRPLISLFRMRQTQLRIVALLPLFSSVCLSVCLGRASIVIIRCTSARI